MALPADAINKYKVQFDRQMVEYLEPVVRNLRPDIWETYTYSTAPAGLTYGHSRDGEGLSTNARKLRILGCFMGVNYTTNDATTEAAIVTAVQALF